MAGERRLNTILDGLAFPEGPRWRDGRLFLSDFYRHRVLATDMAGRVETIAEVPQQPSGLGWTPDGALLIVSMLDKRLLRLDRGALTVVAELGALVGGPCNDMVVDGKGRAFVGNFGFDRHRGEAERTTCLIRVDPDGSARRVAEDLRFPNGTVITPDGRTLVVAETLGQRLTAFDLDAAGELSNRRVFAALEGCWPDGICLDAEGAIWVADARSPRLLRVAQGGAVLETIALEPGRNSYACMLGGDDRRTLFVLTNTGSGPQMGEKRDGRVETVRVEVPGAGWP
jgi:sugar lactone lactonase YvrE